MGKTCGIITGLLVLVAGLVMLLAGLNVAPFAGSTLTLLVAGVALALVGISVMVHAVKACPLCKGS